MYFQPPPSVQMVYPCIVYSLDYADMIHADDLPYRTLPRYSVTIIDPNPDTEIPKYMEQIPMARFERYYTADNLNHYIYQIYH